MDAPGANEPKCVSELLYKVPTSRSQALIQQYRGVKKMNEEINNSRTEECGWVIRRMIKLTIREIRVGGGTIREIRVCVGGACGYRAAIEEEAREAQLEVVALHVQLVAVRVLLVLPLVRYANQFSRK